MRWYENKDGSWKTHRRVRTCECCRERPHGACLLPFRKARRVRLIKALDNRPKFLLQASMRKIMRSNAEIRGGEAVPLD